VKCVEKVRDICNHCLFLRTNRCWITN